MSELRELYQEVILQHGKRPRNVGRLDPADKEAVGHNPLCGDHFLVTLQVAGGVVQDARFEGSGCAISTASASLMTDAVKGMTEDDAKALFARVHALVTGDEDPGGPDLGKLAVFEGVRAFPMRVKCASLAWHTLVAAIEGGGEATTE